MDVSVVVPVYNEETNLPILVPAVVDVLERIGKTFEILLIDDGSRDASFSVMLDMKARHPQLRCLRFAKNSGQTAAMWAGFKSARGDIVVTLDADLQNDPEDIPLLLEKIGEYDAVCGWRHKRNDTFVRRASSRIANWIRNKLSNENIADTGCSLKAYRRECVQEIPLFKGMHRFLPTLIKMQGYTVAEVKVNHRPRKHGASKYGIRNRAIPAFFDLLAVRWMKKRYVRGEIMEER